jgi:hypothetical protein
LIDALELRCDPYGIFNTKIEAANEIINGNGDIDLKELPTSN